MWSSVRRSERLRFAVYCFAQLSVDALQLVHDFLSFHSLPPAFRSRAAAEKSSELLKCQRLHPRRTHIFFHVFHTAHANESAGDAWGGARKLDCALRVGIET